jgi:hypothetical protein
MGVSPLTGADIRTRAILKGDSSKNCTSFRFILLVNNMRLGALLSGYVIGGALKIDFVLQFRHSRCSKPAKLEKELLDGFAA